MIIISSFPQNIHSEDIIFSYKEIAMKYFTHIALCSLLVISYPATTWAAKDSPVCTDIGGIMFGGKTECKKGDIIIMTNPMMAAFLCDMTLPTINGENTIICHFLGKKRQDRKTKK